MQFHWVVVSCRSTRSHVCLCARGVIRPSLHIPPIHPSPPHTHTHPTHAPQRYFEATSEWTLDYPPFFAFFERALAWVAAHLICSRHDPGLLRISAEPYASDATVLFQRGSVMVTDLLLLLGVWANAAPPPLLGCGGGGDGKGGGGCRRHTKLMLLAVLTLGSAGLLVVDHMHFQYNGYLMGMLLLSVGCIRRVRLLCCFGM